MNSNGLEDTLFKQKLEYPYEKYQSYDDYFKPFNEFPILYKDFNSTLSRKKPNQFDIDRTYEIIKK